MDALRISASDVDALRYYRADEDADLLALLAQLRKESPPSEAMLAGTALHSALGTIEPGEHRKLEAKGYTFDLNITGTLDLPAIREMKATRDYLIRDCRVTLVGKVDGIHGKRVDDHKFTGRYDAEKFLSSYQWRIYLDVFEADEFRWNVFEGHEVEPKQYVITGLHPLTMHRYPGMGEDIEKELWRFVDFARQHLPERLRRAA